jgi:hypothetical protein
MLVNSRYERWFKGASRGWSWGAWSGRGVRTATVEAGAVAADFAAARAFSFSILLHLMIGCMWGWVPDEQFQIVSVDPLEGYN